MGRAAGFTPGRSVFAAGATSPCAGLSVPGWVAGAGGPGCDAAGAGGPGTRFGTRPSSGVPANGFGTAAVGAGADGAVTWVVTPGIAGMPGIGGSTGSPSADFNRPGRMDSDSTPGSATAGAVAQL